MTNIVAVAKIGKRADSTDPNDFIFHSSYNTFKIILEGTKSITLSASTGNQSFTQAHGLKFIPLVNAFAKVSGASEVFLPNGYAWTVFGSIDNGITFNYVQADATNITFNFDNDNGSTKDISIRYFCLEVVN